jgi:ABC-2 type transport system permease protein
MNRFGAFIIKEFRHILRDRRTLLILFGMPVALVLLFGYVLTNEIRDAAVAIVNPSGDAESIGLTDKLLSSGYFRQEKYMTRAEDLEQAFREGKTKLALVFPPDFGKTLAHDNSARIQLIGDASDPNTATTLINYAQAIIADWSMSQRTLAAHAPAYAITTETRMTYNPEVKSVYSFVPGVMTLILMLVSAMMTSITIAREKEIGTMEVLLASPLKPIQIILGKTTPYLALSFLNAVMVVLIGVTVFGMPILGSVVLLALECALYMFVALSLGILISTVAVTQQQAMFISALGLMMPTMLLSGFIFPRESMPWILQVVGNVIPATWFNQIIKGIMIKGIGIRYLWMQTGILILMACVFIGISLRKFKDRLE